ncbi:uncharacterized protein LOC134231783 [Saccostrea cucullata]|uniref:uncharacterized protein LOC134231783 n=1 Tax=Saccostrea cuccullata TaxID=36930 RepID=UPI002ED4BC4B
MFWPADYKVICNLSQMNHHVLQQTVILMECNDLPPGFTRLILMSQSQNALIRFSCVARNNKLYISSKLYRDTYLQSFRNLDATTTMAFQHGPCSSYVIMGNIEVDNAFCFGAHLWPTMALPCIQRCRQKGWPSESVLSNILSGGFHVVPIGSAPENEEEWRISFSQAEHKIVYSMNHTKFLSYGLFKIFLKEVINFLNQTPVLCSYFTKTIVFWAIQNDSALTWTPENLLPCFWKCFKLLIYWVHIGTCPNFFIPQCNMFRLKVTGSVQVSLFSHLFALYSKGVSCLLLSSTLRSFLSKAILDRTLRVCTEESRMISKSELELRFFYEIKPLSLRIFHIEEFAAYMTQTERAVRLSLTVYQAVTLQCMTSIVLQNTALFLQDIINSDRNRNKIYYQANKIPNLLRLSYKLGYVSEIYVPL